MNKIAGLLLLSFLLLGCTGSETQTTSGSDFKTYSAGAFTISYPSDWTAEPTSSGVSFTAKEGTNLQASYSVANDIKDLGEFVAENKKSLTVEFLNGQSEGEGQFESIQVVSDTETSINGQPARRLVIKSAMKSGLSIRQHQIYLFKDRKGYILTATATDAGYDAASATFEKIFGSFKIQ